MTYQTCVIILIHHPTSLDCLYFLAMVLSETTTKFVKAGEEI